MFELYGDWFENIDPQRETCIKMNERQYRDGFNTFNIAIHVLKNTSDPIAAITTRCIE